MKEEKFGPIRLIPGENRGRYPYCHSLYIEEAGVLIDPSSDRSRLSELRKDGVQTVWMSHWHEDHFMHLDLFDDLPLWISRNDAPPLADLDLFFCWYGIDGEEAQRFWKPLMLEQFHFKPRQPDRLLENGEVINLGILTVDVIATPGHTPGHLALYFREMEVLFLGDYDLTPFGPWYGDRYSSIEETITSIRHLKEIPARIWLTSHDHGIYRDPPGILWERYEGVIYEREERLLSFLSSPRTFQEIVSSWIIYGKPREPIAFFEFAEGSMIKKHLEYLQRRAKVFLEGDYYIKRD